MLLQSLAVLADHVVQTQVQLVKGESLLCVGSSFSRRVVVSFLRGEWPVSHSRANATLLGRLRVLVCEISTSDQTDDSCSLLSARKEDCHVSVEFGDLTS